MVSSKVKKEKKKVEIRRDTQETEKEARLVASIIGRACEDRNTQKSKKKKIEGFIGRDN